MLTTGPNDAGCGSGMVSVIGDVPYLGSGRPAAPPSFVPANGLLGGGCRSDYHTAPTRFRRVTADRSVGGEDYHEFGEQRGQA
ncbi:hypothetical protein GCM10009676_12440 [Prauserella halophila]|uniref:Uncharacterized protein n=1 Tax=Prauserella halophila TaxID=185641 RepID=A0ABN1W1F8_9PSEU